MIFNKLLEKYRQYSFSERDKGDRFERLMHAYLLTDSTAPDISPPKTAKELAYFLL